MRATGTISWVNASEGYAFGAPDAGGPDLFVDAPCDGAQTLLFAGAGVEFDLRWGVEGRVAAADVALASGGVARSWS